MTVSSVSQLQTPSNTEMDTTLIAYMSRRLGLGWEDIAKRLPDVSVDIIKAVVFCKHDGPAPGQPERGRKAAG